jgi:RHS repeat-associated protein
VAETRFDAGATTTTYLHSNWRGDIVMATDPGGAVIGEYSYTTFGEQLSSLGDYSPRFTFSSKERDASGLVYFGFRYYSPALCRWISEDPIREQGGINLYQFCGNDPVNEIDPYGEFTMSEWGGIAGAFAEGFGKGLAAGVDGMIPFADPFTDVYADDCGNVDKQYQTSRMFGEISRDAFLAAGGFKASGINPWLGKVEIHAAHAGGPHQFRHLQMMLRVGRHATKHWRVPLP